MIAYVENPKESVSKLLKLISDFNKATQYNVNIFFKLTLFLYTSSKQLENEISKTKPFRRALKTHQILRIILKICENLKMKVQTLLKEI